MDDTFSEKTVARLSVYRRLLLELLTEKCDFVYSHQLAAAAGTTPAQVRRDLMVVGYMGSSTRGYEVAELMASIAVVLDAPGEQAVALVGVGNLGRAILDYFAGRRAKLRIVAAFDVDPAKVSRVIHGCRCYALQEIPQVVASQNITTAIVAVPAPQAQAVADLLIAAGVKGLLNFAPIPLRLNQAVYVENMDLTTSLEKVAFFARNRQPLLREKIL